MKMETICSDILYEETKTGIMINAYLGEEEKVWLPDKIGDKDITFIAPYAFAEKMITEIRLPGAISEIGRYAFYRCKNLKKMILSDGILEIGGGALNGCRMEEVEIYHRRGEQSALKSILDEIRFAIHARLYYDSGNGTVKTADLLFPEHYEEAVENTPARILYTSHHGAGGYYRQCFYDRKLDYKKYDETFSRALVEESEETILQLSLGRLLYPYELSKEAKERYETYVKEHFPLAVCYSVEKESQENLRFFSEQSYWTEEGISAGIDCAAALGKTEILSALMDEKYRLFPKRKKVFEL